MGSIAITDRNAQYVADVYNPEAALKILEFPNWKIIKADPDFEDATVQDYIGFNESMTASDDDTDWVVIKFVKSGLTLTGFKRATGSWTGRAALFP